MGADEVLAAIAKDAALTDELLALDFDALTDRELLTVLQRMEGTQRRRATVSHRILARMDRESNPMALGAKSLRELLIDRLKISATDAARRVDHARDLGPRVSLLGEPQEPVLARTAAAQAEGRIGADHVAQIRRFFATLPGWVSVEERERCEETLVSVAPGLTPEGLRQARKRLRAMIDPDGSAPNDATRSRRRYLVFGRQEADGTVSVQGRLDPMTAAALEAVNAKLAAPGMCNPDDEHPCTSGVPSRDQIQEDGRTQGQRNHDALSVIARGALASGELGQHNGLPVTIIVTTTLQDLEAAAGLPETPAPDWITDRGAAPEGVQTEIDLPPEAPVVQDDSAAPDESEGETTPAAVTICDAADEQACHLLPDAPGAPAESEGEYTPAAVTNCDAAGGQPPTHTNPAPAESEGQYTPAAVTICDAAGGQPPTHTDPAPAESEGEYTPAAVTLCDAAGGQTVDLVPDAPGVQDESEDDCAPAAVTNSDAAGGQTVDLVPDAPGVQDESVTICDAASEQPEPDAEPEDQDPQDPPATSPPPAAPPPPVPPPPPAFRLPPTPARPAMTAVTAGGTLIPMSDVIRMASHAYHYLTVFDRHTNEALYCGRTKRIAPAAHRIVLYARDRGCTKPGCRVPAYGTQVHHVNGWAKNGGQTNVNEEVLACPGDNRLAEFGWTVTITPQGVQWIPPPELDTGQPRLNYYHHPERLFGRPEEWGGGEQRSG
ncbi:hypothetical protein MMAD_06290 [Mycolicibacterium madagascariense]|uniref:DUF222 domain-containing protein n=1 Tax=Mycolicibacterium madagascariense TaxID=212765 RepID=A0A7I7X9S9_9MYCO|nr:HNH endonuclease [Mycolicibacterium madagascariense]MCV7011814.1 DUF222 domain-containing protein [Mycolicibacterium madagascariense]BBZ26334.1 hypothetical protein MMAD_06290 [Mycolicibacterium madagascariense]